MCLCACLFVCVLVCVCLFVFVYVCVCKDITFQDYSENFMYVFLHGCDNVVGVLR